MPLRGALSHRSGGKPRRAPEATRHPDSIIATLAARQHDVLARIQLLAAGLTAREIERRIASGHLHVIFRGVYAVGTPNVSQEGRWIAAVLAVGGDAALSHRSAAALWRLAPVPDAPIELILAGGSRSRRHGLITHRSTCLSPADLTIHRGIAVTSVPRTLVDLATRVSERKLKEALYKAASLKLFDRSALSHCLNAAGNRRGSGVLRSLLAERPLPLAEANPGLERGFLRFCQTRGLPIPEVNAPLGDFTVDCLWRAERLVVELDSWEFHRDRDSFEADRRRDAWLQASGHRIVRVTDRRMRRAGDELEGQLRGLLAPDGR
jgi:hypothetical protein